MVVDHTRNPRQDEPQGNERDVDRDQVEPAEIDGQVVRVEIPRVQAFERDDARILAKLPVELAVTHVERDDSDGPAIAAGRRVKPPVDAPMSSARMPDGSSPKVSSAWASFSPPRPTHG